MKMSFSELIKSKTVWAGIFSAIGVVLGADQITPDVVLKGIGVVLGAVGVKDAIAKKQ